MISLHSMRRDNKYGLTPTRNKGRSLKVMVQLPQAHESNLVHQAKRMIELELGEAISYGAFVLIGAELLLRSRGIDTSSVKTY